MSRIAPGTIPRAGREKTADTGKKIKGVLQRNNEKTFMTRDADRNHGVLGD
jgi:hypothetical protein